MSKVSKHCSILNYIRHADEELYELIQDLCIGRILVPRKGSPGVTFLRPDKALLKEIQSMALGDNPEEAVDAIQALLLLDHLPTLKDFDDKKSDIPTFHRKKLPIVSADNKKVTLKNGAEIVVDKDFANRNDRANIAVYMISKALVPIDGETADFSNASVKKPKKGGADISGNRRELFERVLDDTCKNTDREPAMELLVALHTWASKADKGAPAGLAELIASQVSYDALASLAIVLQPYKQQEPYYINDGALALFQSAVYGVNDEKKSTVLSVPLYSFNAEMQSKYEGLVSAAHPAAVNITQKLNTLSSSVAKTTVVTKLSQFYNGVSNIDGLPPMRKVSSKQLFAEAELRVMSAVLHDSTDEPSKNELLSLFKNCTLDQPYMCSDKELVASSNVGFYYSTVYLIARSNALLYVPGMGGADMSKIVDEESLINVDVLLAKNRQNRRNGSTAMRNNIVGMIGTLTD